MSHPKVLQPKLLLRQAILPSGLTEMEAKSSDDASFPARPIGRTAAHLISRCPMHDTLPARSIRSPLV